MFGVDDAVAAVSNLANSAISRIWPDATEVEKSKLKLLTDELNNNFKVIVGQLEINKEEAKSSHFFVAGGRPSVVWMCSIGLGYQFIFRPIVNGLLVAFGVPAPFVAIDADSLIALVTGLLGLGGMRSFEKHKGVARENLK